MIAFDDSDVIEPNCFLYLYLYIFPKKVLITHDNNYILNNDIFSYLNCVSTFLL